MPNTIDSVESCFPFLRPDDGKPHLHQGDSAALLSLRSFQDKQIEIEPIPAGEEDNTEHEKLLHHQPSCLINITLPYLSTSSLSATGIKSQVFITTKRIFIVAHDAKQTQYDIAMNAYCVSLHALMSEPSHSLYCQLSDDVEIHGDVENHSNGSTEEEMAGSSKEITIEPNEDEAIQATRTCQTLFDSLSKLMNLNPMEEDDGDGFSSGSSGGLAAMLGLMANAYGEEGDEGIADNDDDDDDDMICRIDPNQVITAESIQREEGGASSEAREQMLQKLDNILTVPPEYVIDGQFDDAEEEDLDSNDDKIL